MQRTHFALLVSTAIMLGALIALVDSSPRWDDTGVSAAMVLTASGLMGTLHPQRAWVWAFAVGWWIPLLGIAFDRFDYASLLALVFGLVGAYAGAFTGKRLTTTAAAQERGLDLPSFIHRSAWKETSSKFAFTEF